LVRYSWFGWVGVEIFFVLSGFVIAYSASNATAGSFLRGRAVRLLPGVWICAPLTAIMLFGAIDDRELLVRLINTMALSPWPKWVDGVYWSLIVEVTFYALIFLLLLIDQFKRIGHVMGLIGITSAFYAVAGHFFSLPRGIIPTYVLLEHGVHFSIGVFLWMGLVQKERRWLWFLIPLSLGGGAEVIGAAKEKVAEFGIIVSPIVPLAIWLIAVLLIVAAVMFNGAIQRHLSGLGPAARAVGLATYPLYLLHGMVGGFVMAHTHEQLGRWPALALGMSVAVLISFMVAIFIEPWLQGRLKGLISSGAARPGAAA
jgi:peptidoglycan/LPS O-acetylase OafA/YrhL